MPSPLAESFAIHDRINRYLLDAIDDEALTKSITPKVRTPAQILAHVHNVRLMWLKVAAPDLMKGLVKFEPKTNPRKADLIRHLTASGKAIAELLERAETAGKVKGFTKHPIAFFGYIVSHESHHRGQIGWSCKLTGHPLPPKIAFGIWEWGVR